MLRAFLLAIAFLTRVPVRMAPAREGELARALAFFPAVGLGLGVIAGAVAWLLRGALTPALVAVAVVTTLAVVTGGLHLDGLADVFDAWGGGGHDRERMLAIMRDSRVGAHGAVAVALVLIAKVIALAEVIAHVGLPTVIVFPAAARWAVVPLVAFFPYARREGLGIAFRTGRGVVEVVIATVLVAALAFWLGTPLPFVAALAIALLFAARVAVMLGGLTGDVYGAAIEIAEVVFLVAATVRLGPPL